jgi:hypothetical protein
MKEMKKIVFSIILVAAVLTSCAQTKCNLKKAYAFYTVSVPGMQMTDENGNPIPPKADIGRFIYFEWSGAKVPEIETILYNNKTLVATLVAVEGNSVIPGSELSQNNEFKITSKKCNSLWKIELQPKQSDPMPDTGCKNIIIKIKGTDKACALKLGKETQLMTMPRY